MPLANATAPSAPALQIDEEHAPDDLSMEERRVWLELAPIAQKKGTLTADYRIPEKLLPRGAKDLRASFSVVNPWRWASSSFDPETDLSSAGTQGGAAVGGYHYATEGNPRSFLLTLRFGF